MDSATEFLAGKTDEGPSAVVLTMLEKLNQYTGGNAMLFVDDVFNAADKSKDRLMSFTEWSDGIRKLKPDIPEAELRKVFDSMDSDERG